jgi:hypothetical protein
MENITTNNVDIIVDIVSFAHFPEVNQPPSVLKMLKCTDNCNKTLAGKCLSDHLLFVVVLHGRLPSSL